MFNKVLVPLDGSKLAECALDYVKEVATGCKVSEVVLLSAVDTSLLYVSGSGADVPDAALFSDITNRGQTHAKDYLEKTAERLKKEGLASVKAEVIEGQPAEKILDYALNNKVDLIVMATHGKSGATRWVMGSIANKVVNSSPVPVMLISPPGCRP